MVELTDKVVRGVMKRATMLGYSGFTEETVRSLLSIMSERDLKLVHGRFHECKTGETLAVEFGLSSSRTYQLIDTIVCKTIISDKDVVEMLVFLESCLFGTYVKRVLHTFSRYGIHKVSDILTYDRFSDMNGISREKIDRICKKAREYVKNKVVE